MAKIYSKWMGGYTARRLLPSLIITVTVIGSLMIINENYLPFPLGISLLAITIAIFIFIIIATAHDFDQIDIERFKSEVRSNELWHFFKDVVENIEEAIAVFDGNGKVVYENKSMKKLKPDLRGYWEIIKDGWEPSPIQDKIDDKYFVGWIVPRSDNKFKGAIISLINVTDIIKMQEKLKKSLNEKNALLKEVHHRVKNNFQVITSLLDLQGHRKDEKHGNFWLISKIV